MPKTATIQARIDQKTKTQAAHILKELNITPSEAIVMYFRQIIFRRGIPFELRVPNEETLRALKDVEMGKGLKTFGSADELFEDLDG